ncbi:hypothetical protein NL676_009788 [Syzygium grande]|nr:hypothetical protein NL676_009788 [Syzygium grande]
MKQEQYVERKNGQSPSVAQELGSAPKRRPGRFKLRSASGRVASPRAPPSRLLDPELLRLRPARIFAQEGGQRRSGELGLRWLASPQVPLRRGCFGLRLGSREEGGRDLGGPRLWRGQCRASAEFVSSTKRQRWRGCVLDGSKKSGREALLDILDTRSRCNGDLKYRFVSKTIKEVCKFIRSNSIAIFLCSICFLGRLLIRFLLLCIVVAGKGHFATRCPRRSARSELDRFANSKVTARRLKPRMPPAEDFRVVYQPEEACGCHDGCCSPSPNEGKVDPERSVHGN